MRRQRKRLKMSGSLILEKGHKGSSRIENVVPRQPGSEVCIPVEARCKDCLMLGVGPRDAVGERQLHAQISINAVEGRWTICR